MYGRLLVRPGMYEGQQQIAFWQRGHLISIKACAMSTHQVVVSFAPWHDSDTSPAHPRQIPYSSIYIPAQLALHRPQLEGSKQVCSSGIGQSLSTSTPCVTSRGTVLWVGARLYLTSREAHG